MDPGLDSTQRVVDVDRLVVGGAALGHEPGGRVVLVDGALPGERLRVRLVKQRPRMSTAEVEQVLRASPVRIEPACPELHRGCGGCDLQHAAPAAQSRLKADIVGDALARSVRAGRIAEIPVRAGEPLPTWRYRSTVRCGVLGDRLAFRRRRSDELLAVDDCLVAHELVSEVIEHGRFPDADEVVVRAGLRTGERLAIVSPAVAAGTTVPDGVRLVGADELRRGRRAWYHEEVAGHLFRISARSFFQSGPEGAEALVVAVGRAAGPIDATTRVVDLYGGVGLFAATLGATAPVLVERSASSVADARINLEGIDATILRSAVERWRPSSADLVVADPARSGLGSEGVRVVGATGAARVVLVSCDVASLVRDVELLVGAGYRPLGTEVVDLFPNTHHVEAVTALELG